ncbi:ATP-binding protein [Massilia sp. CCM 9210]|uniref:sensor histidine kinase n=1 Tax=Massilia scottii TaxID=3057166 RepID=UPI00279640DC|nr:ATP-binding protein [Massilia sp. CCM 9210]MDQ1817105.1 ATP-binding protein [Massilia sp. CCM 9210]
MQAFRQFAVSRSAGTVAAWAAIIGLSAAVAFVYAWSERRGYAQLGEVQAQQLDLYAAALESELGRHEYLPGIVALDHDVHALLRNPGGAGLGERANKRLTSLNARAGSLSIFVLDTAGLVRAASNWYQPETSVGMDLAALPYFSGAMQGGPARYFSRAAARNSPEYYFAQQVLQGGLVLGVVVVKISLDPIESTWVASAAQPHNDFFMVLDADGTIVLSSAPQWRNRKADLQAIDQGKPVVAWPALNPAAPSTRYASLSRPMARQGWRLLTLTNAAPVKLQAGQNAVAAGLLAGFLGLLAMFVAMRRRAIASRLHAREALQRAHDELERRVADRTAELHAMNRALLHEIGEREHAEQVLRASQDDLLHASKLALLGQMSAGITHEISQPLTALLSLSFNAQLLLKRGDLARVEKNLRSVTDLTERMGRLTEQLKSFSRKTPLAMAPLTLSKAVDNTLQLLENRIRTEHACVQLDLAPSVRAMCDANRLEQVLINLCANALDAMLDAPVKNLAIRLWSAGGRAHIRVSDSGAGIPQAVMARLFEPFFSTKLPGQGLGLGLAISADIVRDFGGTLRASNCAGGAAFELDLPLIEETSHV